MTKRQISATLWRANLFHIIIFYALIYHNVIMNCNCLIVWPRHSFCFMSTICFLYYHIYKKFDNNFISKNTLSVLKIWSFSVDNYLCWLKVFVLVYLPCISCGVSALVFFIIFSKAWLTEGRYVHSYNDIAWCSDF